MAFSFLDLAKINAANAANVANPAGEFEDVATALQVVLPFYDPSRYMTFEEPCIDPRLLMREMASTSISEPAPTTDSTLDTMYTDTMDTGAEYSQEEWNNYYDPNAGFQWLAPQAALSTSGASVLLSHPIHNNMNDVGVMMTHTPPLVLDWNIKQADAASPLLASSTTVGQATVVPMARQVIHAQNTGKRYGYSMQKSSSNSKRASLKDVSNDRCVRRIVVPKASPMGPTAHAIKAKPVLQKQFNLPVIDGIRVQMHRNSCAETKQEVIDKLTRSTPFEEILDVPGLTHIVIHSLGLSEAKAHERKAHHFKCFLFVDKKFAQKRRFFVCYNEKIIDCEGVTKDSGSMGHHQSSKDHGGEPMPCCECPKIFYRKDALKRHMVNSCRGKRVKTVLKLKTAQAAAMGAKKIRTMRQRKKSD